MKHLIISAATVVSMMSGGSAVQAGDSLNASVWIPGSHQYSRYLYTYFAERVADRSGGEFEIKVDVGSSVVSPRGAMAELADGITDMTAHAGVYTPSDLPVSMAVEELAMQYEDPRVVIAAVAEFSITDPDMLAEWAANGVVYGAPYTTNGYKLICNKKVATLDELQGAQIRMPGRAPSEWVNAAGGVTAAFNANEQYGALDKGALTCTTTTLADAMARKLNEVADHTTDLPITLFWSGFGIAYNPDSWSDLSIEQRKMLFDAQADAIAALIVKGTLEEEQTAAEKYVAAGGKIHAPDAALVQSLNDFRATQISAAAEIAKEKFGIADPNALYDRFEAVIAKWEGLLADVPANDVDALADLIRSETYSRIDFATYGVN